MFGWRKNDFDPMEAELREATLKRLAEVLGWPEETFAASEAPRQIPPKPGLEISTELRRAVPGPVPAAG
jgi:hypothetical protein